jgi:hypothetical protein
MRIGSQLLTNVFSDATTLVYTSVGYNSFYADWHWKSYSDYDLFGMPECIQNLIAKFLITLLCAVPN